MKFLMSAFFTLQSCFLFAQENDTIRICNDKWFNELIKTDSISEINRIQDFSCYFSLFDSLKVKTKISKYQLLKAIGNLKKYADGAFSEWLYYNANEYVYANQELFFEEMKKANRKEINNWAFMIYYESLNRLPMEGLVAEVILEEFKKVKKQEKLKSWKIFKEELIKIDKIHNQKE